MSRLNATSLAASHGWMKANAAMKGSDFTQPLVQGFDIQNQRLKLGIRDHTRVTGHGVF